MVIRRQRPNAMQVFRQQHKSINSERMSRFNGSERRPQQFDIVRFAEKFTSPKSLDSEKISASGSFSATILHNEDSQVGRVTAFSLPDILAPEKGTGPINPESRYLSKIGKAGHKQHARPTRLSEIIKYLTALKQHIVFLY